MGSLWAEDFVPGFVDLVKHSFNARGIAMAAAAIYRGNKPDQRNNSGLSPLVLLV